MKTYNIPDGYPIRVLEAAIENVATNFGWDCDKPEEHYSKDGADKGICWKDIKLHHDLMTTVKVTVYPKSEDNSKAMSIVSLSRGFVRGSKFDKFAEELTSVLNGANVRKTLEEISRSEQ